MSTKESKTNKTILRVLFAGVVVLLFCGAAVGAVGAQTIPTAGGSISGDYKLVENVILENKLTVTGECTIDLNGYVLRGNGSGSVITVNSGGNLTVQDSNESGKTHYFSKDATTGLYTYVDDSTSTGNIPITGGCITGGNASDYGGGVCVEGGILTLAGGNIVGNKAAGAGASSGGGGVCVHTGSFTMNSGSITGNTSNGGGGVRVDGTFTMNGGTINENNMFLYRGGGVYVAPAGSFTMNNGTISKNTAANGGGGVSIYSDNWKIGTFTMVDGTITENIAKNGGGVRVDHDGAFEMRGGCITKNKATGTGNDGNGGGVCVNNHSSFTMNNGTISENTAKDGGGVWVQEGDLGGSTFTMTGGEISSNTTVVRGGGVYVAGSATFNVSGTPVISGNTDKSNPANKNNVSLGDNKTITLVQNGSTEHTSLVSGAEIWVNGASVNKVFAEAANSDATMAQSSVSYFHSDDGKHLPAVKSDEMYKLIWIKPGITPPSEEALVYDGQPKTLTATGGTTGSTYKWYKYDEDTEEWVQIEGATSQTYNGLKDVSDSGKFKVGITLSTGGGEVMSEEIGVEITPKPVKVTNPTIPATKEYDGTVVADISTHGALPEDAIVEGDTVSLVMTAASAKYADKNVGTGKNVTFAGYTLSGADAGNYALSQPADTTAAITAKDVTITGLSVADKVYDGNDVATATGGTLDGVIDSDTVTIKAGTAKFNSKDVGTATTVTFTGYSIEGKDAGNYNLSAQPADVTTAKITAKALTITAKPKTITYGEAPANAGVTYDGFVDGETESVLGGTLDYDYSYTQYGDVGNTYTITPKGLTSTNYAISFVSGTLTVTQKPITNITAVSSGKSSITKTYDGNTTLPTDVVPSSTDIVNKDAVIISYDADVAKSHYDDKTAKTGKNVTISGFSLSGAKSGNYTVAADLQITPTNGEITKKAITIDTASPDPIEKVYDGNTTLPSGVTISSTDIVSGDAVTFTFNGAYADAEAGEPKTVNFTDIKIEGTGTDNGNYTLSGTGFSTTTGKITQRPLSDCTIDTIPDQTYTGSPITPDPVVKYGNLTLTKGTDYTVSYADNTGIGTATVTVTAVPNSNYSGTNSASFNIVAGQTAVTLDPQGGTGGTASVTAIYGQPMPSATMPTQSGYTFGGYYDAQSGGTQYYTAAGASAKTWDKTVTAATLYAQWTRNAATVTFNVQGHGTAPAAQTVDIGSKVTRPADPSEYGYTFGGWYKEPDCTNEWNFESDTVQGNMTLYAKWTINTYTVTFNVQGHGSTPAEEKVKFGGKVPQPADPSEAPLTFDGWYKEPDCITPWNFESDTVLGDMTLYAKWVYGSYTIKFDGNGGTIGPVTTLTLRYGDTIKLSDCITAAYREGYTHTGWAVTRDGPSVYAPSQDVQDLGNITLYAVWTENTEILYGISATVWDADGHLLSGVTVELKQGNAVLARATTSDSGTVSFTNVAKGVYNLVAKTDGKIKTEEVTITDSSQSIPIYIPKEALSSVIEVSAKAGTPAAIVGGADKEVVEHAIPGESVTITVKVEAKTPGDTAETERETQEEIRSIIQISGGSELQHLGLTVEKTVTDSTGSSTTEQLEETETVLEFLIPYDFIGKKDVTLYRCHNGTAAKLTPLAEKPDSGYVDGRYWLDIEHGMIYLYASKFSTYSVSYRPDSGKRSGHSGTQGSSIWLTETPEPTPAPTPAVTRTPGAVETPSVKPIETQPGTSPVPFAGILAGLGAAAVVFGLRMRR